MARHASGKNNYSLSGGAVAFLIIAALLLVGLVFLLTNRGGGSEDTQAEAETCVAGDLVLPVAASDRSAGQQLIDDYLGTNPVVREHCVKPELVSDLASAAVYIAPLTPVTNQALENADRSAAVSDPEAVFSETVGVVGASEADAHALDVSAVRFPVGEEPAPSALVASLAAGNDNDAVKALTDQRIDTLADFDGADGPFAATSEFNVPEGLTFTPLDAKVVFSAIPLNQNDRVDENQARAGQDFARAAAERFDGSAEDQPVIGELVWAAALPAGGNAITGGDDGTEDATSEAAPQAARTAKPENTLFLLDTSDAMAPYIQPAADGISEAAVALAEDGKQVALWNYSSPLTPGVVNGYRQNVDMTPDGSAVADSVQRFLTGGVPQTREAVQAAVAQYAQLGGSVRIVLVTTGTADAGDDKSFTDAVRQAGANNVDLSVVHVGGGEQDEALNQVASNKVNADTQGEIVTAVRKAAGV